MGLFSSGFSVSNRQKLLIFHRLPKYTIPIPLRSPEEKCFTCAGYVRHPFKKRALVMYNLSLEKEKKDFCNTTPGTLKETLLLTIAQRNLLGDTYVAV
jgi:hypothetical protein